jgi:hypothetical protein
MRFPGLVVSLLVCAACAPNPKAPANVMALVPTVKGDFSPFETQLTTVSDVVALKGSVLQMKGGARVRIDPSDPALVAAMSDDQIKTALLKDQGSDVHVNYVDKSGVLWPADFHSWMMVTTYLNFERANAYYTAIFDGKPTDDLLNTTVDYWASFTDVGSGADKPAQDNALYFSPVKSFLILPFDDQSGPGCDKSSAGCSAFDLIPLPMNPGVIGHEYGHWVFSHRVYSNAAVPAPLSSWTLEPFNLLKSIDEGFADYHGFGVTCLTSAGCRYFLPWSIDSTSDVIAQRDFTDPSDSKCMTPTLRTALTQLDANQFLAQSLQYQTGTLFTVSMYQAGEKLGKRDLMQKALVASYDDDSASTPGLKQLIDQNLNTPANFIPETVVDTIAAHITDPALLKEFCGEAANRLQLVCDGSNTPASGAPCGFLPHCGNQWVAGTACPVIPPP